MKIKWYGHAAFKVEKDGYSIFLDPFSPGSVPGIPDIDTQANEVYCSHGHGDHNFKEAVKITDNGSVSPFEVTLIKSYHDHHNGEHRGENNITLISDGNIRVAHLGDLGHLPGKELVEKLKNVDALMIPVGGYFTINAIEASVVIDMLKPKVVIPMHYRSDTFGYDIIGTLDTFLNEREDVVTFYTSDEIEVDENSRPHIAVLKK